MVCSCCQATLDRTFDQLLDFMISASSRTITKDHISAIGQLSVRTGAIQFLLQCWASDEADELSRKFLESNLKLLGYRKTLHQPGTSLSHSPSKHMKELDAFLRRWALMSTLLAFIMHEDVRVKRPFIVTRRGNKTLSKILATGLLVSLLGNCTVVQEGFLGR